MHYLRLYCLCAGGVIHSKGDSQEMHFMIGLLQQVQQFLIQYECQTFNCCHNNSLECTDSKTHVDFAFQDF
jgi:hypothetical protein